MNRTFARVFSIYAFAYAFLFASQPLDDGDFWYHLKTGQYIVQQRAIPKTDIFSVTYYGKPWVTHEWLTEVIFYLGYSWFGYASLILLFTIITVLAFWVVTRRLNGHPFILGVGVLLGVWSIMPTLGTRPRAFTLLCAAIYLALLDNFIRDRRPSLIWLAIPLMVVWVNLHGGFLIGLVLIAATIVGVALDAFIEQRSLKGTWPRLRTLSLVLFGCAAAALLNPLGWRIYLYPFEIFFSPVLQQTINDWVSPDFHQPELLPLAALILMTTAVLALSPQRPRPSEVLLFVLTLYTTLKSNRHMAIFALVAVPLLIRYLNYLVDSLRATNTSPATATPGSLKASVLITLAFSLPLLAFAPKLVAEVYGPPKQNVVRVPIKAVQYMNENGITGPTFTERNIWGGYLIWAAPANPVYVDGRLDMYGDQFTKHFLSIVSGATPWQEPFARYQVKNVIAVPRSYLARSLGESGEWELRYQDEMSAVFSRRSQTVAQTSAGEMVKP